MHRRKSSKEDMDDGDTFVLVPPPDEPTVAPILTAPPNSSGHGRHRNHSTPHARLAPSLPQVGPVLPLLSPGLLGPTQPPARRPPSISLNSPPTSPFRASHARVRSISSGPFMPPVSSPLASNFHVPLHPFEPGPLETGEGVNETGGAGHGHGRRHSRLHSRNLSIFFPRQHATISEDTISDVESAPLSPHSKFEHMPTSQSEPLQVGHDLTASFSFGSSGSGTIPQSNSIDAIGGGITTRRGHHHKHSLSHNFFSFLDPSAHPPSQPEIRPEDLHTVPTPAPMSPWSPVSNVQSAGSTTSTMLDLPTGTGSSRSNSKSPSPAPSSSLYSHSSHLSKDGLVARVVCVLQFCLGALVWVRGQAIGSLACTGLGYWVVFDAFGIAVGGPLVGKGKRGFFPARTQTTLLFAQCVYLMFAGVYVAKEAIEHILLSAGGSHSHSHSRSPSPATMNASAGAGGITRGLGLHGAGEMGTDGHHHHWGDERPEMLGLRYPLGLVILVLFSLLATSVVFEQHDVLVRVTNKYIQIPSPLSLLHRSRPSHLVPTRGNGTWERVLRNPYALPPILFCLAILCGEMVLNVSHYTPFDLSLATLQVIITTHIAYAACVVLGGVLLQTAPASSFGMGTHSNHNHSKGVASVNKGARGVGPSTGLEANMEAFWRVVREIERHEHVVSLPAPHVWQVCPPGQASFGQSQTQSQRPGFSNSLSPSSAANDTWTKEMDGSASSQLIITLSPHVPSEVLDEEVLKLTRWACERVRGAFAADGHRGHGHGVEVEVCVGVLRG
ncbi:hypothetical protein K503DRAFT_867554 [Rhizopogon vinicolor AM-OR11-026]|uniref:Cation efflux protein n=1 Tax=Rhizopogon vinicolor AM-OR11-026 TaxID=1314800 RepID=A0A1B7MV56_9AGAM|nr:hypothetical protein K503DRAFT_867554 [Rhizopogon vinicolor AM-OR11-026]